MAYDYFAPPPGYYSHEYKPLAYDYSTPTPGYIPYDYKRNDATSPSGKHPYPYTTPYTTKPQQPIEPSRRGHRRQASYSSVASVKPDSIRSKFQGDDLSPEAAHNKNYEKYFEVLVNGSFAFSPGSLNRILNPKSMASFRELGGLKGLERELQTDVAGLKHSSAAAYPVKEPSPTIFEPNYAPSYPSSPLPRSYKPQLDRTISDIYQDELYNPSMQNVPKTISPKDALLDFDDAEEDAKTSLFTESETSEVSAVNAGNRLHINKNKMSLWLERWDTLREKPITSGVGRRLSRKVSPGIPRPATFKRQEGEQRPNLTPVEPTTRVGSLLKTKQGLVGFANGSSIAAMADTGSRKNVISASYAKKLDLRVEGLPSTFEIGNSRKIQSIGTVSLHWTFADKPKESFPILCDVLPYCTYNLILGNSFLIATKTLTEFCQRLTKCLFRVVNNISHFSFLGETCQRLHGTLADNLSILALPDTGADRNVMSLQYALENELEIKTGPKHCGYLQFADGSYDLTVGQVKTHWTFATGERIPVTFEVLEYCCSDVIIGEEILTEHNVFQKHEASIFQTAAVNDDCFELAPFDFVNSWQKGCEKLMFKAASRRAKGDSNPRNGATSENVHFEEQHRRNIWNHKYAFGTKASLGEGELERARRERYESLRNSRHLGPMDDQISAYGNGIQSSEQRMPVIPSIPTSQTPR